MKFTDWSSAGSRTILHVLHDESVHYKRLRSVANDTAIRFCESNEISNC